MKKFTNETYNIIGKWVVVSMLVICSAFFANKGNTDAAGAFGLGAAGVLWLAFLKDWE